MAAVRHAAWGEPAGPDAGPRTVQGAASARTWCRGSPVVPPVAANRPAARRRDSGRGAEPWWVRHGVAAARPGADDPAPAPGADPRHADRPDADRDDVGLHDVDRRRAGRRAAADHAADRRRGPPPRRADPLVRGPRRTSRAGGVGERALRDLPAAAAPGVSARCGGRRRSSLSTLLFGGRIGVYTGSPTPGRRVTSIGLSAACRAVFGTGQEAERPPGTSATACLRAASRPVRAVRHNRGRPPRR